MLDPDDEPTSSPPRRSRWEPLHAALALAAALHAVALMGWWVLAPRPQGEPLRTVARVDLVDRLDRPRPPRITPRRPTPPLERPGGGASPAVRRASPTGRHELKGDRPRTTPSSPPSLPKATPRAAYPRARKRQGGGEPAGVQGESPAGSGGDGNGDGDGDGNGQGAGAGDPAPAPAPEPTLIRFQVDAISLRPALVTAPEGEVILSLQNLAREPLGLKVEGQGGELYGGQWRSVPPGDTRSFQIPLKPGFYTITVPERPFADGFVARLEVGSPAPAP